MNGYRIYGTREREADPPPPDVRVHPLAQAQGVSWRQRAPECADCARHADCLRSVIQLGPFARRECEQASRENGGYREPRGGETMQQRKARIAARVLAVLRQHQPASAPEVAQALAIDVTSARHHLQELVTAGRARCAGYVMHRGQRTALYAALEDA